MKWEEREFNINNDWSWKLAGLQGFIDPFIINIVTIGGKAQAALYRDDAHQDEVFCISRDYENADKAKAGAGDLIKDWVDMKISEDGDA